MRQLFIIVLLFALAGCSAPINNQESGPQAVSGWMDVSGNEVKNDRLINLNGEWLLYWNQLLQPRDFHSGKGELTGSIEMPSNWYKYKVNGKNLPRDGYATFLLNMKISNPGTVKGLLIPVMYSNYRLWVDDELVAVSGKVGKDREHSVPRKNTNEVYFHTASEQVQIVLQISNFHNYAGGMGDPIVYGSASAIQVSHDRNFAEQCLLLGIILLSGIYHVGLSFFRKNDHTMLLFGLFCLNAAFRNIMVGDVILTKILPDFPWVIAMKLEYLSLYLMVPLMASFIHGLFPEEFSARMTKCSFGFAFIYSVLTLVLDADVYYRFLIVYQIFIVLALVYALSALLRSVILKREGAMFALAGFSAVVLTALVDIVRFVLSAPGASVYSVGVTLFIVCFSFVLSKKLSVAFNMSEQLALELTELNAALDKKVYERTLAIEESHKKLEELNLQLREWSMVDGLTSVSNRRHFDDYLNSQLELSIQRDTPLTLLLIDIDFFKLYNDTYGHTQGDFCLQEVVKALRLSFSPRDGLTARYGGEEFAVVLPNCNEEKAAMVSLRMCTAVRQLQIPHVKSEAADVVTVSIGAATVYSAADKEYKRLIHLADQRLYKAKSTGKNRVCAE